MRVLFIGLCIGAYFFVPPTLLAHAPNSEFYTYITYIFMHGNVWHLAVNMLAFNALWRLLKQIIRPAELMGVVMTSAVVGALLVPYNVPVMGASAVIYTLLGIWARLILAGRIAFTSKFDLHMAVVSVVAFSLVGIFKANTAGALHTVGLLVGFVYAYSRFRTLNLKSK